MKVESLQNEYVICKIKKSTKRDSCRRKTRGQVLQQHFITRLEINNIDMIVLKQIAIRILTKWKEDFFWTEKLEQKNITF